MYSKYRGLSSTPKRTFWFEYLYGRESADTGVHDEAVMLRRNSPAVDYRADATYYLANTPGLSDSESHWGI